MTDAELKQQDIRQVQEFLRAISASNEKIPQVVPDGIYGPQTAGAVRAFQEDYGLPITGEVDEGTWDSIVRIYDEVLAPITVPAKIGPFPSPLFVLKKNDSGNLVFITQAMLNEISKSRPDIIMLPVNGIFDTAMEEKVKALQNWAKIYPTGKIDRETWNKLAEIYNGVV